ncbi:MAG: hypothetical protein E7411_00205 [Ruminococcaceae bacterium]|nr:hypothetical protein [Oscillospiraceae bacterium]
MINGENSNEILLIILVAVFFLIFFSAVICLNLVLPLLRERRYIKTEMRRSRSEGEYLYWKNELKKIYLRRIPIIGRFIIKK